MEKIELPVTTACQLHSLLTLISQVIEPILKTWPETEVTDIEAGVEARPRSGIPEDMEPSIGPVAWYSAKHTRPTLADRAIVLTYDHGNTSIIASGEDRMGLLGEDSGAYKLLVNSGAMWRYADAER